MSAPEDITASAAAVDDKTAVVGTKRKAQGAAEDVDDAPEAAPGSTRLPDEAPLPAVSVPLPVPLQLGPKSFTNTGDVYKYFGALLSTWTMHQNFNEYEHMVLEQLLRRGHPNADGKVGCGLKAFQVRIHPEFDTSRCFFVLRTDGTEEDFSYRKCLETLLPNDSAPPLPSKARKARTQKVAGVDARRTPPKGKLGSRGRAARGRGKDAGANRAGIAKPGRGAGGRGARGGAVRGRGRGRAGLGLRK